MYARTTTARLFLPFLAWTPLACRTDSTVEHGVEAVAHGTEAVADSIEAVEPGIEVASTTAPRPPNPTPAQAETVPIGDRMRRYIAQTEKSGPVRMIVRFEIPFTREPELRDQPGGEDLVVNQQNRIEAVQTRFVAYLQESDRAAGDSARLFESVPYLAVDLGPALLEHLVRLLSEDGKNLLLPLGTTTVAFDLEPNIQLKDMGSASMALPLVMRTMLQNVQAGLAHNSGHLGAGQTIVIIDDGIDAQHAHLADRSPARKVIDGGFFSYKSKSLCPVGPCLGLAFGKPPVPDAFPEFSHGTNVAIVSAGWAPDEQHPDLVPGVAPEASLVAIRVEDEFGVKDIEDVSDALAHVGKQWPDRTNQVAIVCLSLGSDMTFMNACDGHSTNTQLLFDRVDALDYVGVPVVVAAGNQNASGLAFPACLSNVVAVATSSAYSPQEGLLNWSGDVDLVAPGLGVYVPNADGAGKKHGFSGTSAAAPQVAGAIALLRSATNCSAKDILDALKGSPVKATKDGVIPLPLIQIQNALDQLNRSPCGLPAVLPPAGIQGQPIDAGSGVVLPGNRGGSN